MYGRRPHGEGQPDQREQALLQEHVEDVLGERRSHAILSRPPPPLLPNGTLVYVRDRSGDRRFKVDKKWQLMRVLKQSGVKVLLGSLNRHQIVERHVRDCVPAPEDAINEQVEGSRNSTMSRMYKVPLKLSRSPRPSSPKTSPSHHEVVQQEEPEASRESSSSTIRTQRGRIIRPPQRLRF
ncbi:hypothetical protein FOL47_009923 [Perkinsus chesapeaki]|uniref:Uncharacterized protein n=1 Tax=Perkinsus chesapeaki TaxID=330153 RepID=A0A7J6L5Q9_PERCH|nr:hypothetical protein FOL47_009923 [Perkinsus chesapeaki]